jgi:trans-aconitate 2-methyltransferase
MTALAAQRLGDGATILCQDLLSLSLPEPVEVIFSNATLHWVRDHSALFRRLHDALAPGGRLVAQCGGDGNVATVRRHALAVAAEPAYAPFFRGFVEPWTFPTPEATETRLADAGFADARCWLAERPTTPAEPREFCRTSILVRHLDMLPEELRDAYVDAVMSRLDDPVVFDYVRLNILARRPPSAVGAVA